MMRKLLVTSMICAIILSALMLSSCNLSVSTSEESAKEKSDSQKTLLETIETSTLQYPARDENYIYNIYPSFVEISKYIGTGTDVVIPKTINELPVYVIGPSAFEETAIVSVTVQEGVYIIGSSCFASCAELTKITLPETLVQIDDSAFIECAKLEKLTFPANVTTISSSVCKNCTALEQITILCADGSGEIQQGAFQNCSGLKEVYVTRGIEKIGSSAFDSIPKDAVFYGEKESELAQYCADNFCVFALHEFSSLNDPPMEETESESPNSAVLAIVLIVVLAAVVVLTIVIIRKNKRRR